AAAMFIYALAKGAHQNYLPAAYLQAAEKGYRGTLNQFAVTKSDGAVDFKGTVSVAGLGGNPYRDGSYEYYLSEKVVTNDSKGVGAFLLAVTEIEKATSQKKVGTRLTSKD
ncbi:MAG TPA: glycoside hydrolase family 88 protein, partial [Pyrinomonadaceae bacterium]|nr:glycoside hydrolase family 88 protein [Pyrinomonadaceae bacterium]